MPHNHISYTQVLFTERDIMSTELLLAPLKDLETFSCGIGNVYLNDNFHENIFNEAST